MRIVVAAVLLAACGETVEPEPCVPELGELPVNGPFVDPYAIAPEGCAEGGLATLPGRWFVVDPTEKFNYFYPQYEGTCETGFRRSFEREDDHDESDDGFSFYTYSDGTVIYSRRYFRFETPEGTFEFASAFAGCMREDGTFVANSARRDFEGVETISPMTSSRFGPKEEPPAAGLELLGEVAVRPGEIPQVKAFNVVVDGTHAYVVGPFGLDVIDVSDPRTPEPVGYYPGGFNDVRVVRGGNGQLVAFVAPIDGEETLAIDVTDPANPTLVHTIMEYSHSLQVQTVGPATFLYLANYSDRVPRFDVTNPATPVRVDEFIVPGDTPAGVHDLTVDGGRIYANYTDGGFVAFDANALGAGIEVGRIETSYSHASAIGTLSNGRRIVLHGDEGMTGSAEDGGAFLRIVEGDPASPNYMTELARYRTRKEVGIHNIELRGDRAFIAYYQDGVRVLDLSTPEQPREVAHFNTWQPATAPGGPFEGAIGIRLAGDLVYVADTERGLMILRSL